jgi:hypothetical protein
MGEMCEKIALLRLWSSPRDGALRRARVEVVERRATPTMTET